MSRPSPVSPRTTILVLLGTAVAAAVVAVALPLLREEARDPIRRAGAMESSGRPRVERGRPLVRSAGPQVSRGGLPEEDLWAMVPSDAGLAEIVEQEFRYLGGIRSPGTDTEAARLEVDDEGWAERQEAELRATIAEQIVFGGARLDRISCRAGRCLVELSFDSMSTAISRIEPVREWLLGRVRCPAYTEGPDEGESPSVLPSQQIWVLCGQPRPH